MKFNNTYDQLPASFFSESTPAEFSAPTLLAYNAELAEHLGIDLSEHSPESLASIFSGQTLLPGSHPISMAYAAHQFGNFVPRLGDGRALLLGEVVNANQQRYDIQLKGSGPTDFSRNGDGLSALGPVVREYIVSEAMYYLNVPATRALAAVNTGDTVYRQGETPGGVFTRVAASHIRIGTFQYFANRGDLEGLIALLDYSINRHYPEINEQIKAASEELNPAILFLEKVMQAQATLVAKWMSYGFIHGVMNTDNTTISGETIDFGPCAFMDNFKHNKVFSSIDSYGRYAYDNQSSIAAWNLCRLADCLVPLIDKEREKAVGILNEKLAPIFSIFEAEWHQRMTAKLGLVFNPENQKADQKLIDSFLAYLEEESLDFTLAFRNLSSFLEKDQSAQKFYSNPEAFGQFEKIWQQRLKTDGRKTSEVIKEMNEVNPLYIARNHQVERAIEAANEGDLSIFNEMNEVLKKPFTYQEKLHHYSLPPQPEEEVKATFCGT